MLGFSIEKFIKTSLYGSSVFRLSVLFSQEALRFKGFV
jgi:hypothetical protein